ncbi:hypothetical protein SDC9_136163 [bioreactor metagenome]|uniref:Uncharacterized protein n=1 Tax=bioreactor metagenome TaxID=1076179 RepID=A0A645DIJ6_9ZZZZ
MPAAIQENIFVADINNQISPFAPGEEVLRFSVLFHAFNIVIHRYHLSVPVGTVQRQGTGDPALEDLTFGIYANILPDRYVP